MHPILFTAALAVAPPAQAVAPTVALAATPHELLAAWALPEQAGARLLLSRWRDGEWSRPVLVARGADLAPEPPLLLATAAGPVLSWRQGDQRVVGRLDGAALVELGRLPAGAATLVADPAGAARLAWLEATGDGVDALRTAPVGDTLGPAVTVDPAACPGTAPVSTALSPGPVLAWVDPDANGAGRPTLGLAQPDGWQVAPAQPDPVAGCGVQDLALATPAERLALAWRQDGELRLLVQGEAGAIGPLRLATGIDAPPTLVAVGEEVVVAVPAPGGLRVQRVDGAGREGAPVTLPGLALAAHQGALVLVEAAERRLAGRALPLDAIPAPSRPAARVDPPGPGLPEVYALPGFDGATVDVAALRGRPVLVNLWASWCPPCLVELPALLAVHEEWAPRGLSMVGIAIDDRLDAARKRVDEHGIPWPIAFDGSGRASQLFETDELPTTILYDAAGRRVWAHKGELDSHDPELRAALGRLLGP